MVAAKKVGKYFVHYKLKSVLLFFLTGLIIINLSYAQEVEHNYLVGPQNINCDSLDMHGFSMLESIAKVRTAKFRFDQSFRLTRKQGLQRGEFYSCDGDGGFLIIKYDGKETLYLEVSENVWKDITSSSDPEAIFLRSEAKLQKFH